ncbi:BolA family protein [Aliagarivorans taiwanensis]|uniref:BolA family protein n=1 Tax=Aliagarivorans taiwanensis TaxID=561966 RepID=UPI00040EB3CB|nr:BolA/IbaG family iron-sulfur metabolism protein [Aliagarivorans taiwanensis]
MHIESRIVELLNAQFSPENLQVVNESHRHNVPAGSESHFKVSIVGPQFAGKRLIQRHRMVNQVLADLLADHIHALAIHAYTPDEWAELYQIPASPPCAGGEA